MARKILVAEALDERDLLAKKITDKIGKISFVDVIRPNEENVFNLRQEKEKYIAKVKSSYQQLLSIPIKMSTFFGNSEHPFPEK